MRRLRGDKPCFDVVLDRLDDDDGVVHDDADGQHQAEQRQVVQAEADGRHDGEGADDGDRHGDQRDQRRPPVLQEHQHDDGDQDDRVDERLEDLVDRLADERRRVVGDLVVDVLRETSSSAPPSWRGRGRRCRGRWRRAAGRRRGWRRAGRRACWSMSSVCGAEFDAADVLERGPCGRPASVRRTMSSNCSGSASRPSVVSGELEWPAAGDRRLADVAGGDLHVLLADGVDHVAGRQVAAPPAGRGRPRRACCNRAGRT